MALLPDKDWLLTHVGPARAKWADSRRPPRLQPVGPGEESVWDYPRPPELRPPMGPVRVEHGDIIVAQTDRAMRIVETAGAPVYFCPPDDVRTDLLHAVDYVTICEWKGAAVHYDLVMPGARVDQAAFVYPDPLDDLGCGFSRIAGWFAFYPARVDACFVGDAQVTPQPGGYYAGWVTPQIKGPIKGAPGTQDW